MEGPHIRIEVPNIDMHEGDTSDDNDFGKFMVRLEKINPSLWDILRPLTADSSNEEGRPRYVISDALLSKGVGWTDILKIMYEDEDLSEKERDFKRDLFNTILPYWDDRSEEENKEKVKEFIKKVFK